MAINLGDEKRTDVAREIKKIIEYKKNLSQKEKLERRKYGARGAHEVSRPPIEFLKEAEFRR